MKPVRKAVFPVAGLGTRFLPATKASPKEMLAVVDKPLIQVTTMLEKPQPEQAPSTLAVAGRYVLTPGVFDLLAKGQRGVGGEIQLTDAIEQLTRTEKVFAHRYEGRRYDCGSKLGLLQASVDLAEHHGEVGSAFSQWLQTRQPLLAQELGQALVA